MSLGLWPDAVPFDEQGGASDELRKHFDAAQLPGAVLLVCSRSLRGSTWPAKAAVGLARALASGPRAVVLADLDFESPSLHEVLNEPNGEGLADALLFGASLERVTISPAGEPFEFVPAGGFAPDPLELLLHSGWSRLLGELSARNALLLAFAPMGVPGLDGIAERIPSVIVLAGEVELAQTVALLPETIRLEGVIRPVGREPEPVAAAAPPEPPAAPAPAQPPVPPEPPEPVAAGVAGTAAPPAEPDRPRTPKDEAREALIAELRARQALERGGEESASPPEAPPGGPTVQPPRAPQAPSAARPAPAVLLGRPRWGWIAVIVGLAAAGFLIGRLLAGGRGEPVGTSEPVTADSPAKPAGVVLNYSVAVEAYDQLAAALARADSLSVLDSAAHAAAPDSPEPRLTYYVAPVLVDGLVWYRVMAGPLPDSAAAAAALNKLVGRGWKASANEWDVRPTPLAFFLGRFGSRDSAVQRMRELRTQGVPTYVVDVPYSSGPDQYHLYGGAYAADSEAAVMRDLLRGLGLTDTLMLRLGRGTP